MNLTPKVTVIYAFSNTSQFIEPYFIFPNSLRDSSLIDENDFYNELGHLTPQIFLSWIEKCFRKKIHSPIILLFCSRLPVLSSSVLSSLEHNQIYSYGYPFTRTLPFRYLFERRVRNNRSTNLISELWKKKLLDEQRTHVLKGSNCTVTNIKYYFEQIWLQIIEENHLEEEKCYQAFEQANIRIKFAKKKPKIKLTSKKNKSSMNETTVDQLNHLLTIVNHVKEQIISMNSSQILKQSADENWNSSIVSELVPSSSEKRSIDENDQPHISKRLRSTCSQSSTSIIDVKWIPPSKQLITHLQSQCSSLFQFTRSLINTILPSTDLHLTVEHSRWLHSTISSYTDDSNPQKIDLLIETACQTRVRSIEIN